jgi:hypothetical protein
VTDAPQLTQANIKADHEALETSYATTFKFQLHFVPDMTTLAANNSNNKGEAPRH